MKSLLKLEEFGQFLLSIYLFSLLPYAWWVFPALILVPDVSMAGYLINTSVGAFVYNLFHHKLVGISLILFGFLHAIPLTSLVGVILFAHAAMDRIFGYGLKYGDGFKHTHLGVIGRR